MLALLIGCPVRPSRKRGTWSLGPRKWAEPTYRQQNTDATPDGTRHHVSTPGNDIYGPAERQDLLADGAEAQQKRVEQIPLVAALDIAKHDLQSLGVERLIQSYRPTVRSIFRPQLDEVRTQHFVPYYAHIIAIGARFYAFVKVNIQSSGVARLLCFFS